MKTPLALLKFLLRWFGAASLLAFLAVVMPYDWMNAIHQAIGLGPLPTAPIVGYLARSTSAFYALFGALLWHLSLNLPARLPTVRFVARMTLLFGVILLGVDWAEGLPLPWKLAEGPMVMLIGGILSFLAREPGQSGGGTLPQRPV